MKKVTIKTQVTVYNSVEELPSVVEKLMNAARIIKENAYAPYSKFKVGAALLLDNGEIICGNNQENAAYPSGMCAERVAIWKAVTMFPDVEILKIAITASSSSQTLSIPVAPCGACRQSMSEYEIKQKGNIEVYFMGETGEVIKTNSLLALLPLAFNNSYL